MSDTPPCPQCGGATKTHCNYCYIWECLMCGLRGWGSHVVPRDEPKKKK